MGAEHVAEEAVMLAYLDEVEEEEKEPVPSYVAVYLTSSTDAMDTVTEPGFGFGR